MNRRFFLKSGSIALRALACRFRRRRFLNALCLATRLRGWKAQDADRDLSAGRG